MVVSYLALAEYPAEPIMAPTTAPKGIPSSMTDSRLSIGDKQTTAIAPTHVTAGCNLRKTTAKAAAETSVVMRYSMRVFEFLPNVKSGGTGQQMETEGS